MPLQDNALLTLDEAKAFLGGVSPLGANEDAIVTDMINRVSDYAESGAGAGRPLKARAYTDVRLPGQWSQRLYPPAWPIDVTATLVLLFEDVALAVWVDESDGDQSTADVVVGGPVGMPAWFCRAKGWLSHRPLPVRLTYTGGFDPVPGDLKEAAYLTLENVWRAQTKKVTDVNAPGSMPAGASWPSLIPMKARDIFSSYRVPF